MIRYSKFGIQLCGVSISNVAKKCMKSLTYWSRKKDCFMEHHMQRKLLKRVLILFMLNLQACLAKVRVFFFFLFFCCHEAKLLFNVILLYYIKFRCCASKVVKFLKLSLILLTIFSFCLARDLLCREFFQECSVCIWPEQWV